MTFRTQLSQKSIRQTQVGWLGKNHEVANSPFGKQGLGSHTGGVRKNRDTGIGRSGVVA